MDEWKQQKFALAISIYMSKALQVSLSPQSRKLVMEMVLINKDMFVNTPNYMLPPKLALAQ